MARFHLSASLLAVCALCCALCQGTRQHNQRHLLEESDLCYDSSEYLPSAIAYWSCIAPCSTSDCSGATDYCPDDLACDAYYGQCSCISNDYSLADFDEKEWCGGLLGAAAQPVSFTCTETSNNWITNYNTDSPYDWTTTAEACASPGQGAYAHFAQKCCGDTLSACHDPNAPGSVACFADCGNANLCELGVDTSCSDSCRDVDKEALCEMCMYPAGFSGVLEPLCSQFFPDVTPVDLSCIDDWNCGGPMSTLDNCDQDALNMVCGFCYNNGNGAVYDDDDNDSEFSDYDPARFQDMCVGACFSGDSTVTVLPSSSSSSSSSNQRSRTAVSTVALRDLAVGDRVLAVDHASRKETFSRVEALPHSPSHGEFVEVTTKPAAATAAAAAAGSQKVEEGSHTVKATEEHTFPLCGTGFRKEVAAKDLKVGDCLLTAGGRKSEVASLRRVAASEKAHGDTYTVVLEGAQDLVVVGGVVTHARPSMPAVNDAASAHKAVAGAATPHFLQKKTQKSASVVHDSALRDKSILEMRIKQYEASQGK